MDDAIAGLGRIWAVFGPPILAARSNLTPAQLSSLNSPSKRTEGTTNCTDWVPRRTGAARCLSSVPATALLDAELGLVSEPN